MNMSELEKLFIGFDLMHNSKAIKAPATEYPRYNIVKQLNGYQIELAVPGWTKDQVSILFSEDTNCLTIVGKKKEDPEKKLEWVHKGISGKSFERVFKLDSNLFVSDADMADGMLIVNIQRFTNSGVKTIPIGQDKMETA